MPKLMDNFFWGGSSSSFQSEGAYNEDGKGLSVYDRKPIFPGASDWKVAVDFYHRYKEDIDLLAGMGMNMYRLQISWSRVFPNGDSVVNPKGLEFYDNVINYMKEKGVEPIVCLYHFDMPLVLAEQFNGFASREVLERYVEYATFMINHFKGRVKYYLTFNEQNLFMWKIKVCGGKYPEGKNPQEFLFQGAHYSHLAHARVVNIIKGIDPEARVGAMVAYNVFYPDTNKAEDIKFARDLQYLYNEATLDVLVKGEYSPFFLNYLNKKGYVLDITDEDRTVLKSTRNDFVGFSYYCSRAVKYYDLDPNIALFEQEKSYRVPNKNMVSTERWNQDIDPLALRMVMNRLYNEYRLPVFVLENGIGLIEELDENGEINDDLRIRYFRDHITAMKKAILEDEVNCLGYLTWGPIDILSSFGEMKKRYGFVFVNRDETDLRDLRRIKKKSYAWMKQVCESNGEVL